MRFALLAALLLLACPSFAELDERIKVAIEEPVQGERYSGISNLRGWAVSPEGMGDYYLSVYIDDEFAFYLFPYGNRTDVGNAFPDYPDSDTGGFSMAFNYKDLSPGEHEIRVRAVDNAGNYNDAVTTFTTERFESSFIASDSDVDVSTSETWTVVDKQTYLVSGPTLEGQQWDFLLKWDTASQSFKTEGILPHAQSSSSGSNTSSGSESDSSGSSDTSDSGETAACESVSGYWAGLIGGEASIRTNAGLSDSDYYNNERRFYFRQSGCDLTFEIDDPKYLSVSGSITGSEIVLYGQPIATSVHEKELEEFAAQNGIYGAATARSITLNGTGKFYPGDGVNPVGGPRIFLRYTIAAEGTFRTTSGQTISYEYLDIGSGDIYP